MKDLFDFCEFGDLKLNSRIVRTGLWESQRENSGNLTPEIYNRYENMAASGVGLIITELFSLYPRDAFHFSFLIFKLMAGNAKRIPPKIRF